MPKNIVLIKHPKNWGLSDTLVGEVAKKILNKKNLRSVELSIVFVGRKKAKDLNIKYRQKDYVPQVLGFPMSGEVDGDGMIRLGDIVICTQKLKFETKFQNKTMEMILNDWIEHGVDNLLM